MHIFKGTFQIMKCYEVEKWVDFILPDKRGEINRPNQNEKGENF